MIITIRGRDAGVVACLANIYDVQLESIDISRSYCTIQAELNMENVKHRTFERRAKDLEQYAY